MAVKLREGSLTALLASYLSSVTPMGGTVASISLPGPSSPQLRPVHTSDTAYRPPDTPSQPPVTSTRSGSPQSSHLHCHCDAGKYLQKIFDHLLNIATTYECRPPRVGCTGLVKKSTLPFL